MQAIELTLINSSQTAYAIKENDKYSEGDIVVVSLNNSDDLATVKSFKNVEPDLEFIKILNKATEKDKQQNCENCKYSRSILPEIKETANKLNLNMKIGFITLSLDKSKINVFYTAEERVDFRELIKILGSSYKSRIEMHQIGNRDETKQIGAMGVCGRVTCCKLFLDDFDKVGIKMAKNQNISLNPTRINGMCGRLLCCLKYEDEYYAEMQTKMPKENSTVLTPDGKGVVTARDFLKQTVTVTFTNADSTEIKTYNLTDISKK